MHIQTSRRRFLQGSVALTVFGATTTGANTFKKEDESIPKSITTKTSIKKAENIPFLCGICVNKCAGFARVEDGIITKLNPNPYFPKSRNMLCARGNAGLQTLYDPDRLKYPLVRIGKRGEGKYKRVSWDEAIDTILHGTKDFKGLVQILDEEKDNRSTIAFCNGEGLSKEGFETLMREKIGSANYVDEVSICLETTLGAYLATIGAYGEADLTNADYLIIAGANRAEAIITPDTMDMFKRSKRRGLKTIVLDPRFTNTAAKADRWYAINPGTDLAFVLAMTYVVLKEELYDKKFANKHIEGLDEYKKHIFSKSYTPKWAEKITGIPEKEIYKTAREFMSASSPIYYQGRRSVFSKNDYQLRRAMAIFQGLSGNLDKKGGIIYGKPIELPTEDVNPPIYANTQDRFDRRESGLFVMRIGSWIVFRDKILQNKAPYPVRAMFMRKHNPLSGVPNTEKTKKLLEKMDLNVMIDILPSDSAMYADVILPESTYLERRSPLASYGLLEPAIVQRKAAIKPLYESKPAEEIFKLLGEKFSKPLFDISKKHDKDLQAEIKSRGEEKVFEEDGYNLAKPWEKSVKLQNREKTVKLFGEKAWKILEEKGVYYPNIEKFHKQLNPNEYQYYPENEKYYTTQKDKLKVKCNLSYLKAKGVDPMPQWKESYNFKVPKGEFRLITGRHAQFTQSATTNNIMLRDLIPTNYLWINKRIAKEKKIKFGDMVEVKSPVGKVRIQAYPTEKIAPNQVFMIHGFGVNSNQMHQAYQNGANDATLIEDKIEPVYGAAVMNETNVTVEKV